nr:MAG TPA: hypothetical protein [Caudoviricetes sp.]
MQPISLWICRRKCSHKIGRGRVGNLNSAKGIASCCGACLHR